MRVIASSLGSIVAMAWSGSADGQEAASGGGAEGWKTVAISEVNRILTDPSRTTPETVRFAGVVNFVSRAGDFNIQDGDAGVFIEPPSEKPTPKLGDRVEVGARIAYRTADLLNPSFFLHAEDVKIVGPGTLPEPKGIWLSEALRGSASGRRVWVEGVVMQATVANGVIQIHLTDTSGWAVVNVHEWRSGTVIRDWWGARLKVVGANVGRGHTSLRVTSSDEISIVQPGTADCFSAPLAEVATLRAGKPTADRVRLRATVLGATAEKLYARSDAGAPFESTFLAPFPPTTPQPHPLELLAPRKPESLNPGDRIELVGSPLAVSRHLAMSFSSVRVLEKGALPPPVDIRGKDPGEFACDLVTLNGRVRWHDPGRESRLELDCSGVTVHALMPGGATADGWQPGEVLKASGLLLPPENGRPLTLQVSDVATVKRLSDSSSNWRALTPLARRWITGLTVGLGVALAGTWWLQRLVRQRTAALASTNEALHAEVAVREKAEAELARALQQERELGELKSRFVSMVSHEFRTPLGITMSAVELLQHYQDRLPPGQKEELLGDIQRSTKNMADLMEQVLLLGRVEAGRLGYRPVALDMETLARKLADESLSATNRRCPIDLATDGSLSGACGDESLLRHIVSNLLSNAVKYSPPDTAVRFSVCREGIDGVIRVQDQGIGIPPEEKPRLFEAFHRCANVGDIPGTGLGLVIVKRCVDLHGGTIALESEPGKGTTFTVRLPLWRETGAPTAVPAAASVPA